MGILFRCASCCLLLFPFSLGSALGQDSNFATGPQYLMNYGSPLFARSIATPSYSLAGPPLETGANDATAGLVAGADDQTTSRQPPAYPDLFSIYYGVPSTNFIEISFPVEASAYKLPASILDLGVWQVTSAEALKENGYGVSLGEAAVYNKTRVRHAIRVFTNADVDRPHRGD